MKHSLFTFSRLLTITVAGLLVLFVAGCTSIGSDPVDQARTWTAPDPNDAGGVTACAEYDLRMTTDASLSIDQWEVVPNMPLPQPAGSAESHVVTGLLPNTDYWFAIRSRDEANLWSSWSNIRHVTTPDNEPPTPIGDLL